LLDEKDAFPEEIKEAALAAKLFDRLLEACDFAPLNAEDVEKIIVEALRLALLVFGPSPLLGEAGGAGADFIPGEAHAGGSKL
jgi:hypothetical protein